jgi:amidophosphoribosyltransferase
MRISCPPTVSPCFYGVDTPRRSELIAATHTLDEIRKYLNADSVSYLSLEGLTGAVTGGRSNYCTSCYTGVYPVAFPRDEAAYLQLALKLNPDVAIDGQGEPEAIQRVIPLSELRASIPDSGARTVEPESRTPDPDPVIR